MSRRRCSSVVVATVVLLVSACGVTSQDEPQPIEESTQERPTATPSFDTETSPPPGTSPSTSSPPPSPTTTSASAR